jgi:opacity protein-like surface antigen
MTCHWVVCVFVGLSSMTVVADDGLFKRITASDCDQTCDSGERALGAIGACDTSCDSDSNVSDHSHCDCCKYWSFFGGWNEARDYNGESENPPPPTARNGSFQDGYALGIARGRCVNSWLRQEFEFSYRNNRADQWTVSPQFAPPSQFAWNGQLNVYSGMANLIVDFDRSRKLTPYVGGGVGFAFAQGAFSTVTSSQSIKDSAFAYQGFGGLLWKANCNASLFTEYRYFGTDDIAVNSAPAGLQFGSDAYTAHGMLVGVQFKR